MTATKPSKPAIVDTIIVPAESHFGGEFMSSPPLTNLAEALQERHNLPQSASISVLWKKKGGKDGDKPRLAKIQLAQSGLLGFYCPTDVVIWLAADHLANYGGEKLRTIVEALLYRNVLRIGFDEELKPMIKPLDFAGMIDEINEYGFWSADLEAAADAFKQADLF